MAVRVPDPEPNTPIGVGKEHVTVSVVPMRRRHLRPVLKIENRVYPRPWSAALFLSEISLKATREYYVAKVGPDIVGYAGLMVVADEGHVTTVSVDPPWHRNGVATRLMLQLMHCAIRRTIDNVTLEVRVNNTSAQRLYHRFGFQPAGIRKGYYAETDEDALIMWAYEVRTPAYESRLAQIASTVPGWTVGVEGLGD